MARSKPGEAEPTAFYDGLIEDLLRERPAGNDVYFHDYQLAETEIGSRLLALDREDQAEVVHRLADRLTDLHLKLDKLGPAHPDRRQVQTLLSICGLGLRELLRRKLPLSDRAVLSLVGLFRQADWEVIWWIPKSGIASAVENSAAEAPLTTAMVQAVKTAVRNLRGGDRSDAEIRKTADRLASLVETEKSAHINPGEAWSDAALADLATLAPAERRAWSALLASCQGAGNGSKPPARWRKEIGALLDAVGHDPFKGQIVRWFALVDRPRTVPIPPRTPWDPPRDDLIEPQHVELLKGLAWCAGFKTDRDLARALAALALSAYRKIPGHGPRLVSLGNAAVGALGAMPGMDAVGQLAILKAKIKLSSAQKEVEKALTAAATREGLPREEIDELAVPAYGMDEVGRRCDRLGEYVAELLVEGQDAELRWSKAADGKPLKSVPAAVKKEHADELKELQASVKDLGKMLTAQRERLDGLYLMRKSWPLAIWRERYLDHPLVGTIARRLIWQFETSGQAVAGIWSEGQLVGANDAALDALGEQTMVSLWHPIGRSIAEVAGWRDWLDSHQVRQPFKQAYREVYVLTDAERATNFYSNRFAAHVLRQHQYHALATGRGWRNKLRLMVDDTYPPTSKDLPEWGLRAEFWVEGLGDRYGQDTTEAGSFLHLGTDQVRFYEIGAAQRHAHASGGGYSAGWNQPDAEPVPLARVPALVLSEVLRDVDLFVGVASVGNDPTWSDGGPEGRHVDYWTNYSFGDLSATGQTRKAVLERLVPRLKIGPRCSFSDKFLVVRGDLRTYKIHLGSGTILMEPNDQYLCIVPKQAGATGSGSVFLPFEGDQTLSIILSKALMLAEDLKISDPTIISQIKK